MRHFRFALNTRLKTMESQIALGLCGPEVNRDKGALYRVGGWDVLPVLAPLIKS